MIPLYYNLFKFGEWTLVNQIWNAVPGPVAENNRKEQQNVSVQNVPGAHLHPQGLASMVQSMRAVLFFQSYAYNVLPCVSICI